MFSQKKTPVATFTDHLALLHDVPFSQKNIQQILFGEASSYLCYSYGPSYTS